MTNIADTGKKLWGNLTGVLKSPQGYGFLISLATAALLSLLFFYPDATMGNQLRQHDMQQGAAIGQEAKAYVEATGAETPRWTNSLFSGMPTFQINPTYPSDSLFRWITKVYGLGLPSPSNLLFMMMAGFLILMACLRVRWYYALIGAIAWGFSTYFIIIIGAGHIWKFVTLAYIPPTIGGIILAYRGKWLSGTAIAALFAMMQVQSNHLQMTYYFLFLIAGLSMAYLVVALRKKELKKWLTATAALAAGAILAVCANMPSLYNTYEYAKETMRGTHSELTTGNSGETTAGLDRNYITQYSYGRSETFSLLIPNVKGGASAMPKGGEMQPTSIMDLEGAYDAAAGAGLNEAEIQYIQSYVGQYFGEPEGTNGPVYVGAIIFALFLLGCIIVRGPLKWTLLILTILSIGLALGRNLMWLTDLFIDYVPMYSKFRTPESILVVAEFTMPLLAILGLQKLLSTPDGLKKYSTAVYISFGVPTILCLVAWLAPSVYGPAITDGDMRISEIIGYQLEQGGYPAEAVKMFSISNPAIASVVTDLRYSMVQSDALRSLTLLVLSFGALMLLYIKGVKNWIPVCVVGALICIDLYSVNHRYLNHESFCTPQVSHSDPFPLSEADRQILADTAMNYRVMDIPHFYQAAPSYHHKAIGGYHAAKLTRYQDLIDRHLSHFTSGGVTKADTEILNMLNAKYIIDHNGQVIENPGALGNAWFVEKIEEVDSPDAEMEALSNLNPATTAVATPPFAEILKKHAGASAQGDTIYETTYAPDRLTYHAVSKNGGVAVFSEVFFPWGWHCTIDGTEVPVSRVNYLLRAVVIPSGNHEVVMEFKPVSVSRTVALARVSVILIYLLVLAAIIVTLYRGKTNE